MRILIEDGHWNKDESISWQPAWDKIPASQKAKGLYDNGVCTLASFVAENDEDDNPDVADIVREIKKLKVGQSYVFNGGAAGLSRFTRLAAKRR